MRLIASLVLMAFSVIASAEGWLCVAEIEGGFDYDKATKSWVHKNFKASAKYLIRRPERKGNEWVVVAVGESVPVFYCGEGIDEQGNLSCEGWAGNFRFNSQKLKFAASSTYPYFAQLELFTKDERPDSMWIGAGLCTAI